MHVAGGEWVSLRGVYLGEGGTVFIGREGMVWRNASYTQNVSCK